MNSQPAKARKHLAAFASDESSSLFKREKIMLSPDHARPPVGVVTGSEQPDHIPANASPPPSCTQAMTPNPQQHDQETKNDVDTVETGGGKRRGKNNEKLADVHRCGQEERRVEAPAIHNLDQPSDGHFGDGVGSAQNGRDVSGTVEGSRAAHPVCGPRVIQFFHQFTPPTATAQTRRHTRAGATYLPAATARAAALLLAVMERYRPAEPMTGPLRLSLLWTFPGSAAVVVPKVTRPDLDNLAKLALDAMTRAGYWRDDAQVVEFTTAKFAGPIPGLAVTVTRWLPVTAEEAAR